jgi:hypothetical protein
MMNVDTYCYYYYYYYYYPYSPVWARGCSFSVLDLIHRRLDSLDGDQPEKCLFLHIYIISGGTHSCLEWDSNPRSQCLCRRRHVIPQIARPQWWARHMIVPSGNGLYLYLKGALVESRLEHRPAWHSLWFSSVSPRKCYNNVSIKIRPLLYNFPFIITITALDVIYRPDVFIWKAIFRRQNPESSEADPFSETLCYLLFGIPDDGQSLNPPQIPSVVHHRQNSLDRLSISQERLCSMKSSLR